MNTVQLSVVSIDPTTAEKMLSQSQGNRSISPLRVNAYVNEILANNWKPYAGTIHFDEAGRLINGHHRLIAIKKSGKTVDQSVMFGVPSDSIEAIDMGKSRTVSDALSFTKDGFKIQNKNVFCAVVSTCHTLINHSTQPISVRIANEFADVITSDGVLFASVWSRKARESKIPNPSLVAGCMIMLWMRYRSFEVQSYCERVTSSVGEFADPCRSVAAALRRDRVTDRYATLAKICAGFPYYQAKREMQRVYGNTVLAAEVIETARTGWGASFKNR